MQTKHDVSWSTSELRMRLTGCETGLSPPVKYFYCPFQCGTSFVDHLCYLCLVVSVQCCIAVTWRVRTDLLDLVCDVYCDFVTFPFGIVLDCIDSWSLPSFWIRTVTDVSLPQGWICSCSPTLHLSHIWFISYWQKIAYAICIWIRGDLSLMKNSCFSCNNVIHSLHV